MTHIQADKLVLAQAIRRHKEREFRLKKELPIPKGDGWIIKGSIFDCNRREFTRALRAEWDKLYVGWNPMKNNGQGCWEVWQQPSRKTKILAYEDEDTGLKIYTTEFRPSDFEHWVADLDFLTMEFFGKLRSMDAWENKNLVSQHDDKYEEMLDKMEQKEDEQIRDIVRDNKTAFKDLLEYTQQGFHPLTFFTDKKKR